MRSSHVGLLIMTLSLLLAGCSGKKSSEPLPSTLGKQQGVQCYQMFTALKSLDNASFKKYQQQFSVINNNYAIYKKNQTLIDGNSAEIIKLELNDKVDIVCARVRSAVFANMSRRANELNKL